jgi:mycobactin lysine-N-oxygenase
MPELRRSRSTEALKHTDLLVVGAGAKGTAIAIKAHVLNRLGLGSVTVTIIEAVGPAGAWMDGNGVSSSREVLAISPSKDVGFPYESRHAFGDAGEVVDRAALSFSWQRYLVEEGRYSRWVDAGAPPVQRRVYGAYLTWALSRAVEGVSVVDGRVERVALAECGERWLVEVAEPSGSREYGADAFVLTGPGVACSISHDLDAAPRLLDCDGGRMQIARAPIEESSDIAIVGGGESALSCVEFVRAVRPDAHVTIYTPGLPMSRVESFLENRAFSNPDTVAWRSLSVRTRREFIARGDRGVFGPDRVAVFAYDERCHFTAGRVVHIEHERAGCGVNVEYASVDGVRSKRHDYVVNCTGFDLLEQMRLLLSPDARAEVERRAGPVWERPPGSELAIGRFLELEGMSPRLHLPNLAGVSQGPGFANLGSLGLLADRVLEPLFATSDEESRSTLRPTASPVAVPWRVARTRRVRGHGV